MMIKQSLLSLSHVPLKLIALVVVLAPLLEVAEGPGLITSLCCPAVKYTPAIVAIRVAKLVRMPGRVVHQLLFLESLSSGISYFQIR